MVVVPFQQQGESSRSARLGELLCGRGVLSDDQLRLALHEQKQQRDLMGRVLLRLRFVKEEEVIAALAEQMGYAVADLERCVPEADALALWDRAMAMRLKAVPLVLQQGTLQVAMADPMDIRALDELKRFIPPTTVLRLFLAGESALARFVDTAYGGTHSFGTALRELEQEPYRSGAMPVIKTVDALLEESVAAGASDIHLEPEEKCIKVRIRVDGVLQTLSLIHREHWPMLAQRLKVLAEMDIVDTRSIQDGRFTMEVAGQVIDFRASILPTLHGENIVIRVLDQRRALLPFDALGFSAPQRALLKKLSQRPEGMVVITGPTGSGKTTTLYALLQTLKSDGRNIMTLEDPIEYQLDGIRQTQVREAYGLGFADGVRAVLRQDPDVVLIGEIRDPDTAQMALRAAMTGSQVFTTLHTQDCFGVFPRLREFGLSPSLMAGNIIATLAQRLVRLLCPACKAMRAADAEESALLGGVARIAASRGCPHCRGTGYKGRTVVSEILPLDTALDEMVASGAPRSALQALASAHGFASMAEDGLAKVREGLISLESLMAEVDLSSVRSG